MKDSKQRIFKITVTAKKIVMTTNVKCSTIGYDRLLRANRRYYTIKIWAWRERRIMGGERAPRKGRGPTVRSLASVAYCG